MSVQLGCLYKCDLIMGSSHLHRDRPNSYPFRWIVGETADLLWQGKPLFVPEDKGHGGCTYCVHPFRVKLRPDIQQPDPKIDWEHTEFQWVPISFILSRISELDHVPCLKETVQSVLLPHSAEVIVSVLDPLCNTLSYIMQSYDMNGVVYLPSKGGLLYIRNDRSKGASELQLETISIMRLTCEEFCATSKYGSPITGRLFYTIIIASLIVTNYYYYYYTRLFYADLG